MPVSPVFVQRSLKDADKITKLSIRSATRVSGKIRARLIESLRSGNKFNVAPYVTQQLHKLLTNTMLASHLSGFRRFYLIKRQLPSLMRKYDSGELKLSAVDDALKILQRRTGLDLADLQEKYDTQALKILNNVSEEIEGQLEETFADLVREGVNTREAIKTLGDKFDQLGLSPNKPYQIETIFRTQIQLTFAAGKYQAEQDPDIQEILWGYKYVTVGDDRVRPEHAALDNVTLPKNDPFWDRFTPPNGWNCRCQLIPIFEEREIQKPPETLEDGAELKPDKGFDFNPGKVLQ